MVARGKLLTIRRCAVDPHRRAVQRSEQDEGTVVTATGEAVTTGDLTWWPVTGLETGEVGCVDGKEL